MAAKDLIYGRLKISQPGPGYYHFHEQATDTYFTELTAETLEKVQINGRWHRRYKLPRGANNHRLDCEVYALAAIRLSGYSLAHLGRGLPASNVPGVVTDVPATVTPPELLPTPAENYLMVKRRAKAIGPRRGGWVKKW
jgi:phage terminase large subunit GpA-like protein